MRDQRARANALNNLGNALESAGRFEEAVAAYAGAAKPYSASATITVTLDTARGRVPISALGLSSKHASEPPPRSGEIPAALTAYGRVIYELSARR